MSPKSSHEFKQRLTEVKAAFDPAFARRSGAQTRQFWDEKRIARLKELHGKGWSAAQIMADLGAPSRSAVIGATRRHVHGIKDTPAERQKARKRKPPTAVNVTAIWNNKARKRAEDGSLSPLRLKDPVNSPPSRNLRLEEIGPRECHWPYGDRQFLFCGIEAADGSVYCEFHELLSLSEAERARRRAMRRAA